MRQEVFMSDLIQKLDIFRTTEDALINVQYIIMAIAFGLIIAFIAVYYQRRVIGSLVRAIRAADAIDEESAKTIAELGQENNVSAIAKLRKSASMRNLITTCGAQTDAKGHLLIDDQTRVYIAKEKEERARKQFGDEKDSLIPILIGTAVLLVIVVCSFFIGK